MAEHIIVLFFGRHITVLAQFRLLLAAAALHHFTGSCAVPLEKAEREGNRQGAYPYVGKYCVS